MAQHLDGHWVVSPQDLVAEFECGHKVALTAAVQSGALTVVPEPDGGLDLLRDQGLTHETTRLEGLDPSWRVKRLGTPSHSVESYLAGWQAT